MKSIFLLSVFVLSITSCKILPDSVILGSKPNQPTVYKYEYIGFEYPDSLADAVEPMKKLIDIMPKDQPIFYVIGDQHIALVKYDTSGNITERKVYNTVSNEVILFTYDDDGQYYRIPNDENINVNLKSLDKNLPLETKYFNGIQCEKYTMKMKDGSSGSTVYLNTEIPIEYYSDVEDAPKGVPFYSTSEVMMGLTVNYGVVDSAPKLHNPKALLNMSTEGYLDINTSNNEFTTSSIRQTSISDLGYKQTTYLSIRNDTIVALNPRCDEINQFKLDIDNSDLNLYYIDTQRNDTTFASSNGGINEVRQVNDSLFTAKYKDEYWDSYSIYTDSKIETKSYAQIWKTRRKSSFLWTSFATKCLSKEEVIMLLTDIAPELLRIENPKVFLSEQGEFENTQWMVDISEYSFSKN